MLHLFVFPEDQGMSRGKEKYPKYCTILSIYLQELLY